MSKTETLATGLLSKVATKDASGERMITAVVSSNNLDRDYEFVDVKSLRLPLKGGGSIKASDLTGNELVDIPLLLNHSFDVEDVIGSVRKAYLNETGELVVDFGISSRDKAQDLMKLIDEGHLDNAFSITMSDFSYNDQTIYDAELLEVSLVFRGSNKDARVLSVKSLLKKESDVETEQSLADKKAELERLQKEIADAEQAEEVVEVAEVVETEAKEVEEAEVVETEVETDESVEDTESKSIKKETKMSDVKDIATKQVVDAPVVEVAEKKVTLSKNAQRELFVKQFLAHKANDSKSLAELNKMAMDSDTAEHRELASKAIDYTDGASLYQTEVVASDIQEEYTNVGRVGALVQRVDISGAETWKQIVQTAGTGFQPVGIEEDKQEDEPTYTHVSIEPKEHALVVAWYDAVAKRTPIALYQSLVRYIAREYAKLEDKIILDFAGVTTTGGDTFVATGLVPLLTTAGRTDSVASYDSNDVIAALGAAYGEIESDGTITLVANRKTWGQLATSLDAENRPVFTVVGNQVSAGALGTFNVVVSQAAGDGEVVVGDYADYQLVTNGGLETLFSQEATVGSLNLFVGNASAIRASVDLAGKPVRNTSFWLLTFPATS